MSQEISKRKYVKRRLCASQFVSPGRQQGIRIGGRGWEGREFELSFDLVEFAREFS